MNEAFETLGLGSGLAAAAAAAGFDEPTPVQRQSIPVLRRGGNAVLHAGSGSGVTAAWALGLLDRLQSQPAGAEPPATADAAPLRPRVLVITPTEERAARVARTVSMLGGGRTVRALTLAWGAGGVPEIVVGSAGTLGKSLRESGLKLEAVEAAVFDRLGTTLSIEDPAVLENLAMSVPAAAQRVVVVAELTKPVERFIEAHVRRALTIPPRTITLDPVAPLDPRGSLSYVVATREHKPAAIARVLRRPRPEPPIVTTRSARGAEALRRELEIRGFSTDGPAAEAHVRPAADDGAPALIAYDVPVDAGTLAAMDLKDGLVIVEPDELPHLRAVAAEARIALKAVGAGRAPRGSVAAFRDAVRRSLREEDLDAQVLLLEPLLEEFDAVEVAAALAALLRSKRMESEAAAAAAPEPERTGDKPLAFVRLFVSAGHRDNIRPGDLVGAITGEASTTGEQVGRIEIRDTFSVVEVASAVADRVIRALNGTTLRGRSLRVDYDRRGAPAARPGRLSRPVR